MLQSLVDRVDTIIVSIPITVLGGLQLHATAAFASFSAVSIPITVLGGLQHCAPEPLGLLAPDK